MPYYCHRGRTLQKERERQSEREREKENAACRFQFPRFRGKTSLNALAGFQNQLGAHQKAAEGRVSIHSVAAVIVTNDS